jgi:hypothetical protein
MRVTLMHHFESKTSAVENIRPGVDGSTLGVQKAGVEVETISRFLHSFLSGWRGLYLHLREVSGANVVLREKRLTPTSL